MKLCACGCGQPAPKGPRPSRPRRYINGHNGRGKTHTAEAKRKMSQNRRGKGSQTLDASPSWRGGRIVRNGYVAVKVGRDHPMADRQGYVREHRLVMAELIGRHLTAEEVVHHVDGNPQNNDPANLLLFASHALHMKYEVMVAGSKGRPGAHRAIAGRRA